MNNSPFTDAHDSLERNEFWIALNEFRRAAELHMPSHADLINLSVSEDEDRVTFRRELVQRYPDSLHCHLSLFAILRLIGRPAMVVAAATRFLEARLDNSLDVPSIRFIRFKCAIEAKTYEFIREDLRELWFSEESTGNRPNVRRSLASIIARSADPKFADTLDELSHDLSFAEVVILFLRAKAAELRLLQNIEET